MNERITFGEGKHRVWLEKHEGLGGDMVLILGGGERPHVGAVVLKVPGEEVQTITSGTHKDHHVLVPLAEAASRRYGNVIVATGGVHIDHATPEDIRIILRNCKALHHLL